MRAALHDLSRELKLDGHGDVAGRCLARRSWLREYKRADVFCLPSVQEGFGIVLLEAMAAGKPIVAARAAAIPEVAPHGLLVEPDSPEALAAGIESCTVRRKPATSGARRRASGWSSSTRRAWRAFSSKLRAALLGA